MFDRESLFQMLMKKEWDEIAKILYKNPLVFETDPVIQQAIQLFEREFFTDIEGLSPKEKLNAFEYPGLVVELKQKSFSKSFVSRFVDEKIKVMQALKSDALISFASYHCNNSSLAKTILQEVYETKPELLANEKRQNISIKSTKTNNNTSKTINLFKSSQEKNFFEAIRKAFPTYHPYPNVALSNVIDFGTIKNLLNPEQKDYFFRAVIDSVVFDASSDYKPMYFFELDSIYHDTDQAKQNDLKKDKIFEVANVKLIRIRAYESEETTVEKFETLVLEIMRDL